MRWSVSVWPPERGLAASTALIGAAIIICLALQLWLALVMEVNWDEFYYLSQIYEYERGELTKALQTVHVHFLGWLTGIRGGEIRQIEVGRLFMLLCEAGTCITIYLLARTFFSHTASCLAVLAYVSAGFTIIHGASFRTDPLAAMLIMSALVSTARAPLGFGSSFGAALAAALAAMVTVKVVFYAPAFLAISAWRWRTAEDPRRYSRWMVLTAVTAVMIAAALYLIHLLSLPGGATAASNEMILGSARTTIFEAGFAPRVHEIIQWALFSPFHAPILLFAACRVVVGLAREEGQPRIVCWVVVSCAAPLLSLLFYRNAFPYFFAFVLPPAMLLVAWISDRVPLLKKYAIVLALGLTAPAIVIAVYWSGRDHRAQEQLIAVVHEMFPKPVPYIDRNSMISSFPKRGFFMSTWGMLNYQRNQPLFARVLEGDIVPLLILNSPTLENAVGLRAAIDPSRSLSEQDREILRRNFIPHWGPIWVAGQRVEVTPAGQSLEIKIPGTYTIELAAVEIDGRHLAQGDTATLSRGTHSLRSDIRAIVTLRWGDHLPRPAELPIDAPIYRGF